MSLLSIVIPVYNEVDTIADVLARVRKADLPPGVDREIIVIDDCSTDGTREYLENQGISVIVLYQEKNRGKGAAVRAGLRKSSGDFIVIQDADLEYDPADYQRLLEPLLAGQADVVFGSRFLRGRRYPFRGTAHYLANRFLTALSNFSTGLSLSDMETCYKMFAKKVVDDIGPRLVSDRFDIEPEITARVAGAGYRVAEVGISYRGRSYAKGKKIGWRDGIAAVRAIIRFSP